VLPQLFVVQIFIHFMHNLQPKFKYLLMQARGYLSQTLKQAHMRYSHTLPALGMQPQKEAIPV